MRILTITSVFPNDSQPFSGLFIRERMKHVANKERVHVVAPVPVSPFDSVVRKLKPGFRPASPAFAIKDSPLTVDHPPFLCFPGLFKQFDGLLYFLSLYSFLRKIKRSFDFQIIDSHFAYPDGVAAYLLSKAFRVPFTVTLRGTEVSHSKISSHRWQIKRLLNRASRIICVSKSLGLLARQLSTEERKIDVIPNGVDSKHFRALDKALTRSHLKIDKDAKVLLTVGGLVERKGFHRVIEILPKIMESNKKIVYLVVGGASVEGDFSVRLREMVREKRLADVVRFEGPVLPENLATYYSAADLFVLPTSNEGWANVFLESLACGTPVVTTDVGGNREVIVDSDLGTIVPFGDAAALEAAVTDGLKKPWNHKKLIDYARQRTWDKVAEEVVSVFETIVETQ